METNSELIKQLKEGNRIAFRELVRHYQRPVLYFALRWTGSIQDAEDVTQRTFINAYSAIGRFREKSSLKTWLYQIALNLCRNHHRDNKNKKTEELQDNISAEQDNPLEKSIQKETFQKIMNLTGQLKEKQRTSLLLRLQEGLRFSEIAEIMNISENSAKTNFHYALNNIRQLVKKEEVQNAVSV